MDIKMHQKRLRLIAVFMLGLGLTEIQAQESVNSSGGNALGSGGSASYSVGQTVYQTHTGTNGSVAEGVQQPYEISVVEGVEGIGVVNLSAYPNPATDYLTLSIEELDLAALSYQMFDMSGKLLRSETITDRQTRIPMRNLTPAIYLVKVLQGNKGIKTFKIIKNQ